MSQFPSPWCRQASLAKMLGTLQLSHLSKGILHFRYPNLKHLSFRSGSLLSLFMPPLWLLWYIAPSFPRLQLSDGAEPLVLRALPKIRQHPGPTEAHTIREHLIPQKTRVLFFMFSDLKQQMRDLCKFLDWSNDTYWVGHDLGRFSAASGASSWEETWTTCLWAICWEPVRETKELYLPWENAESSKSTFFIGVHQFSLHFQEEVSLMQDKKQKVIFIFMEGRELKETDRNKRLQSYSVHWINNVRVSSSFALPGPEARLDLLGANTCMLENSSRGQECKCLSLHNFCKKHLKTPGSVRCQKSSSDTLQTSVPEDSAVPARWMVYILLHLICILPTHQAAAASVPRVRVTSLQDKRG